MTISEVAKKYEMTPEGLRYYERIGLLPPVNRNKNGLRDGFMSISWTQFFSFFTNIFSQIL